MLNQLEKFDRFKKMHQGSQAFVVPNPWDAGSARILSNMDFKALATTSAGYAFSVGKRDSFAGLSRREILGNAKAIIAASDLPVSADLEDGFGAAPEICAETVKMACDIGLVGGQSKMLLAILKTLFLNWMKPLTGSRPPLKLRATYRFC